VKTAIKLKTAPDIVPHHAAKSTIVRGALKSINASLGGCEPFKFTGGLGDDIAGRSIMIRYVDNHHLEQSSAR
jgi:hypothetical protein